MSVIFRGDFDTGAPYQWKTQQFEFAFPAGHSFTAVTDRRRAGYGYAGRFEVQPGDNAGLSKERSEVASEYMVWPVGPEDVIRYYGWSTYFDSDLLNPTIGSGMTNIFTQWHEGSPSRSVPPVRFSLDPASEMDLEDMPMRLRVAGGWNGSSYIDFQLFELGNPVADAWNDFVFGVKWSATDGWVRLWRDGVEVVPQTTMRTMYTGQGVYGKQGFYRSPSSATSVIWHDGFTEGTTKADVEPVLPENVDPGYLITQQISRSA